MEISVSSKTMNSHTRGFSSIFSALTFALLGLSLAATRTPASVEEQAQSQTPSGSDKVSVTLSDPARPALVKAGLISGGITVKAYDGKEVIVEARVRNRGSAWFDS